MTVSLERTDDVFVLTMDNGENRMNTAWVTAINAALDEVESAGAPAALVTIGSGKFFSNGLDLEWLQTGEVDMRSFVADVERVFARILGAPFFTIAACNGHTFAAGAMLAMAHDMRIMRSDRGFYCLPEVEIKIPLTPGMNALMVGTLPVVTAREVLVTGRRFGGEEAARKGIVSEAVPESDVLPRTIEIAAEHAPKAGPTMAAIKRRMFMDAISHLENSQGTAPV